MCSSDLHSATATTEIYTLSLHDALPLSVADGADDAGSGVTPARGRPAFAGEWCRLGSGEACGSLCTEPETVSACGRISTADACGSRAASRAEGEADPTPKSTIALYRTAEAAVAERPSLH